LQQKFKNESWRDEIGNNLKQETIKKGNVQTELNKPTKENQTPESKKSPMKEIIS